MSKLYTCIHVCAHVGIKVKRWSKLSRILPLNLRRQIERCDIVNANPLLNLQVEMVKQRRRWSLHLRSKRSEALEVTKLFRQQKEARSEARKQERLARKRDAEKVKRERAAEMTKDLPRTLVPTNIPDKHGVDPSCLNVSVLTNVHAYSI